MPKSLNIYTLVLAAFFTFALFSSYSGEDAADGKTEGNLEKETSLPQVIQPVNLAKPYSFAGEALPMDNFDVRERLDRELTVNSYWHSSTVLNIKSATRYFPIIEKILEENGVPDDFKYLAVAESSLRNATSPTGAKGIWQFLKGAGQDYGLEINGEVDERYHLEKATQAAAKYINRLKERFGSWTLAAAAYNSGASHLKKEVGIQRASTYYDLNLNEETSRYVFRIVALKEVLQHPQDFGFYLEDSDLYSPLDDYNVVEVDSAIENLGDFASKQDISYRMLKVYNPWLRSSKLTNPKRKKYEIHIPRQKF